jgi:hypothetical protein
VTQSWRRVSLTVPALMTVKGGDVDSLLETTYAQPYVQIFYNVTKSASGVTGRMAVMLALLMFNIINQVTTASRQLWSFARDKRMGQKRQSCDNLR